MAQERITVKIRLEKSMDPGVCLLLLGEQDDADPPEVALTEQDAIQVIKTLSNGLAEGMFEDD